MSRDSIVKTLKGEDGWVLMSGLRELILGKVSAATPYNWIRSGFCRGRYIDEVSYGFADDLSDILDRYILGKRAVALKDTKFPFLTKDSGYDIYEEIEVVDGKLNVPDPRWLLNLTDRIELFLSDDEELKRPVESGFQGVGSRIVALENAVSSLTALMTAGSSSPLVLPTRKEMKLLMIDVENSLKGTLTVKEALTWLSIFAGFSLQDLQRIHELGEEVSKYHIKQCAALANLSLELLSSPKLARITGSDQNLDKRRGESLYREFTAKCTAYFYARQLKSAGTGMPVGEHPAEKMLLGLLPDVV